MYSVIIPTMQGSPDLWPLLETFNQHALVDEILVINNSARALDYPLPPKARVIYEGPNIFVNPAWNLGAETARSDYLIIANDDIAFDGRLLDLAAGSLTQGPVGMIGPSAATIYRYDNSNRYSTSRIWEVPGGYGVLMFLARSQYVPIPESMKIYAGEYWLFWNQHYPSLAFTGHPVSTEMHTTSGRAEFSQRKIDDTASYEAAMRDVLGTQPWHRRARMHNAVVSIRKRMGRLNLDSPMNRVASLP